MELVGTVLPTILGNNCLTIYELDDTLKESQYQFA